MSDNDGLQDFRKSAAYLNELDDGTGADHLRPRAKSKSVRRARKRESGLFGMQPGQAFIIGAMVLTFVCLVGFAVLVMMGKMSPPI